MSKGRWVMADKDLRVRLLIESKSRDKIFEPVLCDGVQWVTERKGAPGKLTFSVVQDGLLDVAEGYCVKLSVNDKDLFLGYIFSRSWNKDGVVSITAYDQLRYFKNKDVKFYEKKRADEVLSEIARDYEFVLGELDNTKYEIPLRRESNQTLFDIVLTALEETYEHTKERYVLYDDFGKLVLRNEKKMQVDILLDKETAENFSYTSSIDKNTYNQVKLFEDDKDKGEPVIYVDKRQEAVDAWGVLQYCEAINEKNTQTPQQLMKNLLDLHSRPTRSLSFSAAFGDIRVRAGCKICVRFDLKDMQLDEYLLVEQVTHTFRNGEHRMDLKVRNGVLNE